MISMGYSMVPCPNCGEEVRIERYDWCEGEWDEDDALREQRQKEEHLKKCGGDLKLASQLWNIIS